tara:strand:- start:2403 stop:3296 length:894 start_codon:yes stop_codon:yes gene_type:complete
MIATSVDLFGLKGKMEIPFNDQLTQKQVFAAVRDKYRIKKDVSMTLTRKKVHVLWDVIEHNLNLLNKEMIYGFNKDLYLGNEKTSKIPEALLKCIFTTMKNTPLYIQDDGNIVLSKLENGLANRASLNISAFEELEVSCYELQPLEGQLQMFVKTLTGTTLTIHYRNEDTTIEEIQQEICRLGGPPICQQNLIFAGKQLLSLNTVREYGICHEATLNLVLRLRGGMYHWSSGRNDDFQSGETMVTVVKNGEEKSFDLKPLLAPLLAPLEHQYLISYNQLEERLRKAFEEGAKKRKRE